MGRCHAQGHDERPRGGEERVPHLLIGNPNQVLRIRTTTSGKAACAERLTSIDTGQKRMIFAPKAFQDPAGSITNQEGAFKTL